MRSSFSSASSTPQAQCGDLLAGIPTQEHADEVKTIMDGKYSASSKASIAAALTHWDTVRDLWGWGRVIPTGDQNRGGKLATFVLYLMSVVPFYPSSTISNYVWALCAFCMQALQADPRDNVIGWSFFMSSVVVLCYVPFEPRKRVPTSVLRSALAAVDPANFAQVQMAVLAIFLYFTFQRSELPCPKTYSSLDPAKHLLVRHMQPQEGGGTRWAVGTTKADPRAERLSGDAGPGREWIVIGVVEDSVFDLRCWLSTFLSFFPSGPRDPDSAFFRAHDLNRPLLYRTALRDFRVFLTGHVDNPDDYGLHGLRSEGFITCSNAVGEEAAVIQGGWRNRSTASRYDRLTHGVAWSMARRMVAFHVDSGVHSEDDDSDPGDGFTAQGVHSGSGGLGVVAGRAAARSTGAQPSSASSPARRAAPRSSGSKSVALTLPPGWHRIWHPTKGGGYATFAGPCGRHARSIVQAVSMHARPVSQAPRASSVPPAASSAGFSIPVENLADHVTYFDRPPARPAPPRRGAP